MRKSISLILVSFLFLFAYHVRASEDSPILIESVNQDVVGDGSLQTIDLYGILFNPDSKYFRDIYAVIRQDQQEWRINYHGGYEPKIRFIDLNHDGIVDIFYQSPTGGSGGLNTSSLDTLAKGKLENIPLPEQEGVKGYFDDGFHVVIELAPKMKPIVLNVEDRKDEYIRLGIFNDEGKLLKSTSLMIDPIAFFEPVEISKKQGYGLKSYKQVSGAFHADQLGMVETLWYYEENRWMILQTKWSEAEENHVSEFY